MPFKGPIARATFRTSLVLGLRLLAQAGTLLLLARLLGPEGFGAFAAVAALAVLLGTLSTFGMHLVVLRDLSQDPTQRNRVLPVALGTTALCGAVLFLAYAALCLGWLRLAMAGPLLVACVGVSELLLQPLLSIATMERQAHGQIARSQLLAISPQLMRLVAVCLIWLSGSAHPLSLYALCHVGACTIALGIGLSTMAEPWPAPNRWRIPDRRTWGDSSSYAVLNVAASGPTELDKALAGHLLPLGVVGLYAAASRAVGAVALPVIAMMLSALPRLFRESSRGGGRLVRWLLASAGLYGALAGVLLWFFAPVIEWMFGPGYDGIAVFVQWLAFAAPGMGLRIATASTLMSIGHPWVRAVIELSGLALLAILAWSLATPAWPKGLVVAVIVSEWAMALVGIAAIACRRPSPGRQGKSIL